MKSSIVCLALVSMLGVSFVGCSDESSEKPSEKPSSETSGTNFPSSAKAIEPTIANAQDVEKVVVVQPNSNTLSLSRTQEKKQTNGVFLSLKTAQYLSAK